MLVELKHVLPNPHRHLPHYPIDREKIKKLKASFDRTGYWKNIVARKAKDNGSVEIAYGHHRRQALIEKYGLSHKIEVILIDFGNADMLKAMADENDEVFNMSPAIINETVKAARDYLHSPEGKEEYDRLARTGPRNDKEGDKIPIAKFLDWDVNRVEEALAEIAEIESPKLTEPEREEKREIIQKMPSQKAAREFRRQSQKYKTPIHAQKKVAEAMHRGEIGTKEIAPRLVEASFKQKRTEKQKRFGEFIDETRVKIHAAGASLSKLAKFRKDLDGPIYGNSSQRRRLYLAWLGLLEAGHQVFGDSGKKLLEEK